jgi:membrane-associated phospholipid phosphatase
VEFICFGMLPWIQTRPPWVLEPPGAIDARHLTMRAANRFFVRRALMPVNTFPSGHAATALAVALATFPIAPPAGALFLVLAMSIAVGSVIGRYHYALDAAAGIALTLVTWTALNLPGR